MPETAQNRIEQAGTELALKHKITLLEGREKIVLDITDDTGGLGLKLYFSPMEAHRLGEAMMDRARFMVAKEADDLKRTESQEFDLKGLPE